MTETDVGKARETYLALLTFLLLVAAARVTYIGLSQTPIPASINYLPPALFLAIGAFYTFWHNHPLVGGLFNALGLIHVAFTGAFVSSVLVFYTGRSFPLIDAPLVAFDQALGFDWVAYVKWFDHHPFWSAAASWAYESIFAQPFVIIIVLVLMGQTERMFSLIAMMVMALTVTSVTALFFPALGPYQFFQLSPADHPNLTLIPDTEWTAPIEWLRKATFDAPMPPIANGLISFPSYHAATAVLYTWAAWRTPVFKWIVLTLNIAMLLATPIHGSHYFVDVIAGGAVAAIAITVTLWAFSRVPQMRRALTPGMAAPAHDDRAPQGASFTP